MNTIVTFNRTVFWTVTCSIYHAWIFNPSRNTIHRHHVWNFGSCLTENTVFPLERPISESWIRK